MRDFIEPEYLFENGQRHQMYKSRIIDEDVKALFSSISNIHNKSEVGNVSVDEGPEEEKETLSKEVNIIDYEKDSIKDVFSSISKTPNKSEVANEDLVIQLDDEKEILSEDMNSNVDYVEDSNKDVFSSISKIPNKSEVVNEDLVALLDEDIKEEKETLSKDMNSNVDYVEYSVKASEGKNTTTLKTPPNTSTSIEANSEENSNAKDRRLFELEFRKIGSEEATDDNMCDKKGDYKSVADCKFEELRSTARGIQQCLKDFDKTKIDDADSLSYYTMMCIKAHAITDCAPKDKYHLLDYFENLTEVIRAFSLTRLNASRLLATEAKDVEMCFLILDFISAKYCHDVIHDYAQGVWGRQLKSQKPVIECLKMYHESCSSELLEVMLNYYIRSVYLKEPCPVTTLKTLPEMPEEGMFCSAEGYDKAEDCNMRQIRDLIYDIDDCYKDHYTDLFNTAEGFFETANNCVKKFATGDCTLKDERTFRYTLREAIRRLINFSFKTLNLKDSTKICIQNLDAQVIFDCIPQIHYYVEAHWKGHLINSDVFELEQACFEKHIKECTIETLNEILKNYLHLIDHTSLCKEETTTLESETVKTASVDFAGEIAIQGMFCSAEGYDKAEPCSMRKINDLIFDIDDCYKDHYVDLFNTEEGFFEIANYCVKKFATGDCTVKDQSTFRYTLKEAIRRLNKFSVKTLKPKHSTEICIQSLDVQVIFDCIPQLHNYAEIYWKGKLINFDVFELEEECFEKHIKECTVGTLNEILKNYLHLIDHTSLCKEETTTRESETVKTTNVGFPGEIPTFISAIQGMFCSAEGYDKAEDCNSRQIRDLIYDIDDCYQDHYKDLFNTAEGFFETANDCVKKFATVDCTIKDERSFRYTLKEAIRSLSKFSVETLKHKDSRKICIEHIEAKVFFDCVPELYNYAEDHWRGNPMHFNVIESEKACFEKHIMDCKVGTLNEILQNYLHFIDHTALCKEETTALKTETLETANVAIAEKITSDKTTIQDMDPPDDDDYTSKHEDRRFFVN